MINIPIVYCEHLASRKYGGLEFLTQLKMLKMVFVKGF